MHTSYPPLYAGKHYNIFLLFFNSFGSLSSLLLLLLVCLAQICQPQPPFPWQTWWSSDKMSHLSQYSPCTQLWLHHLLLPLDCTYNSNSSDMTWKGPGIGNLFGEVIKMLWEDISRKWCRSLCQLSWRSWEWLNNKKGGKLQKGIVVKDAKVGKANWSFWVQNESKRSIQNAGEEQQCSCQNHRASD